MGSDSGRQPAGGREGAPPADAKNVQRLLPVQSSIRPSPVQQLPSSAPGCPGPSGPGLPLLRDTDLGSQQAQFLLTATPWLLGCCPKTRGGSCTLAITFPSRLGLKRTSKNFSAGPRRGESGPGWLELSWSALVHGSSVPVPSCGRVVPPGREGAEPLS